MKKKLFRLFFGGILLVSEILSFSFSFASGYYSQDAQLERTADYATQVATKQSSNGIFAMMIGAKDRYESLLPVDHELYRLYGIFKQEKITFASSINSTKKEHNIILDSDLSSNLSILYLGGLGSFVYKDHFKHYVFPLESMFKDSQKKAYEVSNYICYLSKSQATRLLNRRNGNPQEFDEYTIEDYKTLLYTPVNITIDGSNQFPFSIVNIYFENNYYHSGLSTVMGEYIACSYYLPMNLRSLQRSMYFMSKYTYQNQYFMNYINNTYPGDNFFLTIDNYNINGLVNESLLFAFKNNSYSNSLPSAIYLTFSILLFIAFIIISFFIKSKIYVVLSLLLPAAIYFSFERIYLSLGDIRWFPYYSSKIFFWLYFSLIIATICFIVIRYVQNNKQKKQNVNDYYETII